MTDPALAIATPLIAEFEGFRSHPYQDIVGVWTIGYGATYLADGSRVTLTTPPITEDQGMSMLRDNVAKVLAAVRGMSQVPLSNNQAAALASLAYNEGTSAIRHSTLMRLVNNGDFRSAAYQFGIWVYAGGHRNLALTRRRAVEQALFEKIDSPPVVAVA